jgi:DNA-binding HxlR family transcriptional regulator
MDKARARASVGRTPMEADRIVRRMVHHQVPPKAEYGLTNWGQALCPALDAFAEMGSAARTDD